MASSTDFKHAAVEQWTADPCGRVGMPGEPGSREYFESLLASRQSYAPWMTEILGYAETAGLDVLDVGSGQGIDVALYSRAGARATGIDLTPRHVELAQAHLAAFGLTGTVVVGDGEQLPFPDGSFDRVSSNGVLHHTPDMPAALREILRVLRPGGEARIIVYNRRSFHYWLTQVLWHGLVRGRLLRVGSVERVMSETVEFSSIGARPLVKAYTPGECAAMLRDAGFADVTVTVRHFRPEDTPPTKAIASLPGGHHLLPARLLERLVRLGGWYVVANGRKRA